MSFASVLLAPQSLMMGSNILTGAHVCLSVGHSYLPIPFVMVQAASALPRSLGQPWRSALVCPCPVTFGTSGRAEPVHHKTPVPVV